ncbi:MAG: class I SAM-dependent methyltransferase [Holosporales bacterium]|jgi:ubiquinone/menaquinone biosynthesis C-methylase UbiE|nr:class I SAM-dependent methyltransferase [Holosporales bacterium]
MTEMQLGDFSALAKDYIHRPAYDPELIRAILEHMGKCPSAIADVGAGTGKLTKVLSQLCGEAARLYAVEPNDAMRGEGEVYTSGDRAQWSKGTGEETGLPDGCVEWVTMASSFHWTDPEKSLPEFRRILKEGGFLTILWNSRDVAASPLHREIEELIYRVVPHLKRVSSGNAEHTKNWADILASTGDFADVWFRETSYVERMTPERYLGAWRSVNDIQAQAGSEKFQEILRGISEKIASLEVIEVPYKMRSWTARRV